jgi:hypothetical protein
LVGFSIFAVLGGVPSAVIALVVSLLTYVFERQRQLDESNSIWIIAVGTASGLIAGICALPLAMGVMDASW